MAVIWRRPSSVSYKTRLFSPRREERFPYRVENPDWQSVIEIRDTGCGISGANLPHIFERFYRADKVGTPRGFGLGLSIAKTIVEKHRRYIEVESVLGQGSVFRICLPR